MTARPRPERLASSARTAAVKHQPGLANPSGCCRNASERFRSPRSRTRAAGYLERFAEQPERHSGTAASLARRHYELVTQF